MVCVRVSVSVCVRILTNQVRTTQANMLIIVRHMMRFGKVCVVHQAAGASQWVCVHSLCVCVCVSVCLCVCV